MECLTALIAIGSISLNLVLLYALYQTRVAYDDAQLEIQGWVDHSELLAKALRERSP